MIRLLGGLCDRIFAVVGAFIFSQAPLFMQQYTQRLAGHIAELNLQIEQIRKAAALSNKSLEQYINKFLSNGDIDFVRQGELMQGMAQRNEALTANYQALQQTTLLQKPFVFLSHFNSDIAKTTLHSFEIGIVFTMEGLAYALLGIICGFITFKIITKLISLPIVLLRKKTI